MTTLSKEDVVRTDNELLAMIQKHFPSLPLDDRYTDWGKWLRFAKAVYSHGEQAARADLVAENERLKATPPDQRQDLHCVVSDIAAECRELRDQLTATHTALAAVEEKNMQLSADFTIHYAQSLNVARRLIESQARETKLRDALENHGGNYKLSKGECAKVNALLDAPRDDSALREMIAGVYAECAKACRKEADVIVVDGKEERAYNNAVSDCGRAIRALAKKARHGS